MAHGLTAQERETVVLFNDAEDLATIWTAQRPVITKLRNNPAAVEIDSGYCGTSAWAKFTLPANLLSFRSGRMRLSEDERKRRGERLAQARAA